MVIAHTLALAAHSAASLTSAIALVRRDFGLVKRRARLPLRFAGFKLKAIDVIEVLSGLFILRGVPFTVGQRTEVQINFAYPTLNPEVSVQVPD
jgi:hypothetical protein